MEIALSDIKNTKPNRDLGDISDLKVSITDVGLINPLTIDSEFNLLAGRRRFQAISELGWTDVECNVLPVNGDMLKAFKITLDENIKRKPLTDPEVAVAIKEYDDLKRKQEGERKVGGDRQSIGYDVTDDKGWSFQKTANELNISKASVVKAVKVAIAIEKHPELVEVGKSEGGEAILREAALLDNPGNSPVPGIDASTYRRFVKAMVVIRKSTPSSILDASFFNQWREAENEIHALALPIIDSGRKEVEAANDIYEVVKLRKKAVFLGNMLGEIWLRRQWRLGSILDALNGNAKFKAKFMEAAGIEKREMRKYEAVYSIPEPGFEEYIQDAWNRNDDQPNARELLSLYSFGKDSSRVAI